MSKFQSWVSAARLRTLPLSVSGIIVGTTIAVKQGYFDLIIFSLALGTTLGLQILSNFANDYGDGIKGTDNAGRIGPARAIQSGLITRREMLQGIIITAGATFFLAVLLILAAFGRQDLLYGLMFFLLGIGAIIAAIKYTIGTSAYGYSGFGDLFVLVFFGLVAVYGSYFLYAREWRWEVFLPALSVGFLSMGVLNLNNMRDRFSDERSGKNTLVVKMGPDKAKNYHYFLILSAICAFLVYSVLSMNGMADFLYVPALVPLLLHLKRVLENENPALLDPELKKLALSTFAVAVLFGLGQVF